MITSDFIVPSYDNFDAYVVHKIGKIRYMSYNSQVKHDDINFNKLNCNG